METFHFHWSENPTTLFQKDEAEICSCEVVEQKIDDILLSSCGRNTQDVDYDGQEE